MAANGTDRRQTPSLFLLALNLPKSTEYRLIPRRSFSVKIRPTGNKIQDQTRSVPIRPNGQEL